MKEKSFLSLSKSIEKRFQTTMIGSLARIENYLGFVWGHNKEMISIEQSDNRQIWQDLRDDILDHCNYQMRAALVDLKKVTKTDNEPPIRYTQTYTFINKDNEGEQYE